MVIAFPFNSKIWWKEMHSLGRYADYKNFSENFIYNTSAGVK